MSAFRSNKIHILCRRAIDTLYPSRCPLCGDFIDALGAFCDKCLSGLRRYTENAAPDGLDGFCAFCEYEEAARAVLKLKHTRQGNNYYAFAVCIAKAVEESGFTDSFDIITFPPMTRRELSKRGYNQTKLIARELSFITGRKYADTLIKVRETRAQKELSAEERAGNLRNAYTVSGKADISGRRVLFIDDVCTTGSTISAAAKTLRAAGAESIIAAVFARSVRR